MKKSARRAVRREIFVLTGEEKQIICFVVVALLLGMAVKHYRSIQPAPGVMTAVGQSASIVSHAPPKKKAKDISPDH